MKCQNMIIKAIIFIVASSIAIHIIYLFISITLYGSKNERIKAGAVIVLGAGIDDDTPSPVFQESLFIHLYSRITPYEQYAGYGFSHRFPHNSS